MHKISSAVVVQRTILPMTCGPGRYSQWRSCFLRYIDTKPNGEGLRKSILSGPYVPSTILVQAVAATEGTMTVAGARENCRLSRKPKRVKDYLYHREQDDDVQNKLNKEVYKRNPVRTRLALEQALGEDLVVGIGLFIALREQTERALEVVQSEHDELVQKESFNNSPQLEG
ncbi:hypothetical protein Tco_0180553 [Tanacetum coccineum]